MRYVLLLCTLLAFATEDAHETHPFYIGPLYLGARFNYVDGAHIASPKLVYTYRDLEKLHDAGTHIVVLPLHYTPGELQMAKRACEVTDP